jgi:hypothetical protein
MWRVTFEDVLKNNNTTIEEIQSLQLLTNAVVADRTHRTSDAIKIVHVLQNLKQLMKLFDDLDNGDEDRFIIYNSSQI